MDDHEHGDINMIFGPDWHHRHSLRLRDYDYAQEGMYFVTLCTRDRMCIFGEIEGNEMHLNDAGEIVWRCWNDISTHFPLVELDTFVVMPNHVHGILAFVDNVGAKNFSPLQDREKRGTA
jgi:REP element-mobilizing transposase RayT